MPAEAGCQISWPKSWKTCCPFLRPQEVVAPVAVNKAKTAAAVKEAREEAVIEVAEEENNNHLLKRSNATAFRKYGSFP